MVDTRVEAALRPGEQAGVIVTGYDHAASLVLRQNDRGAEIACFIDGVERHVERRAANVAYLQIAFRGGGMCTFGCSADGKTFRNVGPVFRAVPGRWIGCRIGVFTTAAKRRRAMGHADFDYFRFSRVRCS